jgi:hypothetical protein
MPSGEVPRETLGREKTIEAWAHGQGLRELASDALLENEQRQRAHTRLGFEEVERAVRYRKALNDG